MRFPQRFRRFFTEGFFLSAFQDKNQRKNSDEKDGNHSKCVHVTQQKGLFIYRKVELSVGLFGCGEGVAGARGDILNRTVESIGKRWIRNEGVA